ncbi:MAG: hypothetical protein AAGE52_14375 [Myxococcota bacterium]
MTRSVALVASLAGCITSLPTLTPDDGGVDTAIDSGVSDAGIDAGFDAGTPLLGRSLRATTGHTCAVIDEDLYCWGSNSDGQIGRPGGDALRPTAIETTRPWIEVAGRDLFTCARDARGDVACWGGNDFGQLGVGDTAARMTPSNVAIAGVVALTGGYDHTCAVDGSGGLFCWGRNNEGQLGLDDPPPFLPDQSEPTLQSRQDWLLVDGGQGHSCAVDANNVGLCWGRNTSDELGLGVAAPGQRRSPTEIDGFRWSRIAAGQNHSCGITLSRDLYCWGDGRNAQLGTGDRSDRAEPALIGDGYDDVDLDTFHTCALRAGVLECWGRNAEGQLGTEDLMDRPSPTPVTPFADWVEVSVGRFHTCAKRADNSIWCTGANAEGKLGTGDRDRRRAFTQVWPLDPS